MVTLLLVAGAAVAGLACCGIKGIVWLAGARPARLIDRSPR